MILRRWAFHHLRFFSVTCILHWNGRRSCRRLSWWRRGHGCAVVADCNRSCDAVAIESEGGNDLLATAASPLAGPTSFEKIPCLSCDQRAHETNVLLRLAPPTHPGLFRPQLSTTLIMTQQFTRLVTSIEMNRTVTSCCCRTSLQVKKDLFCLGATGMRTPVSSYPAILQSRYGMLLACLVVFAFERTWAWIRIHSDCAARLALDTTEPTSGKGETCLPPDCSLAVTEGNRLCCVVVFAVSASPVRMPLLSCCLLNMFLEPSPTQGVFLSKSTGPVIRN